MDVNKEPESANATLSPLKEFVFGEKLNDRVTINLANGSESSGVENGPSSLNNSGNATSTDNTTAATKPKSDEATKKETESEPKPLWSSENVDYYDPTENNENTLFKVNCKLYLLEADKANWVERGYGILKVIDSNDDLNCNISKFRMKTVGLPKNF